MATIWAGFLFFDVVDGDHRQPKFTKQGLQVEVEYPPDMDDVPRSGDRRQYLSASKVIG